MTRNTWVPYYSENTIENVCWPEIVKLFKMTILSIDIGKKNLGYCLIDDNISFGLFNIEKEMLLL